MNRGVNKIEDFNELRKQFLNLEVELLLCTAGEQKATRR